MGIVEGWMEGEMGSSLMWIRVRGLQDEIVLETCYTTMWIELTLLSCTYKMVKGKFYIMCSLP